MGRPLVPWFHRPVDAKLQRMVQLAPLARLRHGPLLLAASLLDEITLPPGTVLVKGGCLPVECLLLSRPGDVVVSLDGARAVPPGGATLGIEPWLAWGHHPATVMAGSWIVTYVLRPQAVKPFVEIVGRDAWPALEIGALSQAS